MNKEKESLLAKFIRITKAEGLKGIYRRIRNRVRANMPIVIRQKYFKEIYKQQMGVSLGNSDADFVGASVKPVHADTLVKLIAFYLPQFHPIPENDEWWGRGFTEWTNVSKAVPQFVGHYQPHLPGELGFYDLRLPEVQDRQIELARRYGIHGFAFYYYWFNGKRLLEKPLDMFLAGNNDFPFCICWANENWTRRWDGQEADLLIGQEHSPESDLRFIQDIAHILRDPRYIRINNRPLLLVYRPNIIPNVKETVKLWREYCRQNGIEDPYLAAAQTFEFSDPHEVGFDAAVEFPPHNFPATDIRFMFDMLNKDFSGYVVDYAEISKHYAEKAKPVYPLFKTVFPSWDNEARKPGRGYIFANSSPGLYQTWLDKATKFAFSEADTDRKIVFINAWNEWAEGAHLEPDRKYGYAYLHATSKVLAGLETFKNISTSPTIIFQSGKVGSTSVHISIQQAYQNAGLSVPVYHAHILENIDQRIEFLKKARKDPANSIAKLLESKSIRRQIEEQSNIRWNVINLVRDPVAQKVSSLFQLIDEYIPDWQARLKDEKSLLSELTGILFKHEEFDVSNMDHWYESQIKSIWGLDVFSHEFSKNAGYQIYDSPKARLMIIRLEDLDKVASRSFKDFLGFEHLQIIKTNMGEQKSYFDLYNKFKSTPLPDSYLEAAYNTAYAKHFYNDDEITTFRKKWSSPR